MFFSRDCDGGAGPESDAAAPAAALGAAALGAAAWLLAKLKPGADGAVALGAVAAVDFGGPKLKPEAAGAAVVALAPAVVVAWDVLDAGGLPKSEPPVAVVAAGAVPKRPPFGASALVAGVEAGACGPLSNEKAALGADSEDDVVAAADGNEKEGLAAPSFCAVAAGLEKKLLPAGCEGAGCDD